ncbi:MAG: SAM-dependent methyltransferase [Actinobacteria bacterium]|nr:SAM-dependent methyltransferase [Actinomycetota bacterium]
MRRFLHLPGERLTLAELTAARLDGDVVELGEAYAPADLVETSALRAASLAPLISSVRGAAFAGMSAAWIHGAGDAPPERHELQSAEGKRLRAPSSGRFLVHDPVLEPVDLLRFGGTAVAGAVRTLIDLVRWPVTIPERLDWAHGLVQVDPGLLARAAKRVAGMHHGPGHRRVVLFLAEYGTRADQDPAPESRREHGVRTT